MTFAKSHFGTYLSYLWAKLCQILTKCLDLRPLSKIKTKSSTVFTWDIYANVLYCPTFYKNMTYHKFWTKARRMKILVPRSMFLRSRSLMVQFVLSCDLHLSMSWPLQTRLLGHISVATWQNIGSLDKGLCGKYKVLWTVCMRDVIKCVTLATILQKYIFHHNFHTKIL